MSTDKPKSKPFFTTENTKFKAPCATKGHGGEPKLKLIAETAKKHSVAEPQPNPFNHRGTQRKHRENLLPLISTDTTDEYGLTNSFATWQEFDGQHCRERRERFDIR
jgi:hypothetical protein